MPDQLLPQPPPDAPAPPAGEQALRSRRKMKWLIGGGILSMLFLLLSAPMMFRSRKASPLSRASFNAGQIGRSLSEFETEFGNFPDKSTITKVRSKSGTALALPDLSSNDLFAQLIASETWHNEAIFYAKATSAHQPDNIFNTDETILRHGECAFAYLYGVSSKDDPQTPLAFGPVIPGTHIFDLTANKGKIAVLKVDNSVISLPVNAAGHIMAGGGLELFDPRQPYWHGKAPDVRWPK